MRNGEHHGHGRHGKHGDGHRGEHKHAGAQTFRRGRALAFLETLNVKRMTLIQQLEQPELQAIHPVIRGELKAVEMVRNEFIAMFELYEFMDGKGDQSGIGSNTPNPSDPPERDC